MTTQDLQKVISLVEERTGFRVSVTPKPDLPTHASMQSATPAVPVHSIFINPKYENVANYLVAAQCAMLLLKWSDPERVMDFCVDERFLKTFVTELGNRPPKEGMSEQQASAYTQMIVGGLAHQLTSAPIQILAAQWCVNHCPGLWEEQRVSMVREIRELADGLAPRIKLITPPEVFDRNAAMNAAYTLWWAELVEETQATLPYETLGYLGKGRELLDALQAVGTADKRRYQAVVDSWAAILDMEKWYKWVAHPT